MLFTTGGITANSAGTKTITNSGTGVGSVVISGVIGDGSGQVAVTQNSTTSALTLSGANTYTGDTTVTSGTLIVSHAQALQNSALNTVGTGVITLSGVTAPILGGLSASRNLASVITTGYSTVTGITLQPGVGASPSYSGAIANGAANMTLTKDGTGTQILGGTNTFTGVTTLTGGTLSVATIGDGGVAGNLGQAAATASNLVFNGGTLQYTGVSASTNRNFTLTAAKTGIIDVTTNALTMTGASTNTTGALTKTGAGTLILTGTNLYTGTTTVSAGTLVAGAAAPVSLAGVFGNAASAIILGDAATATNNSSPSLIIGGAFTVARDITIANQATSGSYTLAGNTAASSTFSGAIALNKALTVTAITGGTVNLTKSIGNASGTNTVNVTGAGTSNVILNNATANQFAPTLFSVNSGKLSLGASSQIADATNLTVAGGEFAIGAFNDTVGAVILSSGTISGTATLTGSSYALSNSGTISAILGGASALTKTGAGMATLSGANTYTDLTTVSTGTLEVTVNNALGTNAAGTTVTSGAALKLTDVNYSTVEALSINGTGISSGGALVNSGTSTFAGAITAASNARINAGGGTLNLTGGLVKNGTILTLSGGGIINVSSTGISGSSANSDLVVDGTTVNLGVASSYNGPTYIRNSGTLNANVTNALPTANGRTAVTFDGSGTSTLALGADQSIASLTGALTTSALTLGGNTLTLGTTTGSTTFAGAIGGSGGLIKDGGSTQVLSGTNSYSGGTTVSAGTLTLGHATNTLADAAAVTINGGTLDLSTHSDTVGTVTLTSGLITGTGTLTSTGGFIINGAGDTSISTILAGAVNLTKSGAGILTLSHLNNTYSGTTTILEGKILLADLSGTQTSLGSGTTAVLLGSASGGPTTGALYYTGNTGTFSRNLSVQSGGGEFETTTAGQTLTISGTVSLGGNFLVESAGNTTISGVISGSGNLTKNGVGILSLTNTANSYSGTTTILNGKIQVHNLAGTLTGLGSATSAVTLGGTTTTGGLYHTGSSASSLSRDIAVAAGGGEFENATAQGATVTLTGGVTLGGNFLIEGAGSTTVASVISGSGAVTKNGTGTLTLSNPNTYSGTTTIAAGTVLLGNTAAIPSGTGKGDVVVSTGATLNVNALSATINGLSGAGSITNSTSGEGGGATATLTVGSGNAGGNFTGVIANGSNTLGLIKTGSGTQTLSNTNTYTGGTTVSAGTLAVNGSLAAGTAVTVGSSGTLTGSGIIHSATTVSGTLAPGISPSGLTINGTTTFNSGSIFNWQLDTAQSSPETNRGVAYAGINTSAVAGGSAVFIIQLTGSQDFSDTFWNQTRKWNDIIKTADGSAVLPGIWTGRIGSFQYSYNGKSTAPNTEGSFALASNSLTWTPYTTVPEVSNVAAGMLLAGGLLRRRRQNR